MHTYRVEYKLPSGDRVVGGSDLGVNYKDENEDRVVLERSRVTVVDGMGGQSSGQEAATLIADAVASGMPFHEAMHQAIKAIQTDQNIRNDAGAAVVSAEIKKDPSGQKILDIHSCGDCSLFVLDATGTVVFEAEQDSLVLNLVKQGIITKEEALIHPDKNVVTNAVDGTATPDKSFRKESFPLQPGYRIFIMSDGIGDNLIPEEIARLTHGQALAEAFKTVEDVVTQRMQANGTLTYNAAQKKYSDGYVQPAKKDNRSLIVIDVA